MVSGPRAAKFKTNKLNIELSELRSTRSHFALHINFKSFQILSSIAKMILQKFCNQKADTNNDNNYNNKYI